MNLLKNRHVKYLSRKTGIVGIVLLGSFLLEKYVHKTFIGKSGEILLTCLIDHVFFDGEPVLEHAVEEA